MAVRIRHPVGHVQPSLYDKLREPIVDAEGEPVLDDQGEPTYQPMVLTDPPVTSVTLQARWVGDTTDPLVLVIDAAMIVVDDDEGGVRYDYLPADVDTAGLLVAWEIVNYADGTTQVTPSFYIELYDPASVETPAGDTRLGPCLSWISGDDVAENCPELTDTYLQDAADLASEVLWNLSGRQFPGSCERTVRPCRRECSCAWTQVLSRGHLVGWSTGSWWNDCGDRCGCGTLHRVRLSGVPVTEVTEVVIDGVTLDESAYRLDRGGWLVRVDGGGWPACQNLAAADDEEGAFAVTYSWGLSPPMVGVEAAKELACQLARALGPEGECVLPSSVTGVVRQGIQMSVSQVMAEAGNSGLAFVNAFLAAYNPNGLRRRPIAYSPDLPTSRRIAP